MVDRPQQPVPRRESAGLGQQVARERGVSGPDRGSDLHGWGVRVPRLVVVDQDGTGAAQGDQGCAHAAGAQRPRGVHHGGRVTGGGATLQLGAVDAGQLPELLAVGFDQVGRRVGQACREGGQWCVGGVDGEAGPRGAERTDQVRVEVVRYAARQGPAQHHPRRVTGEGGDRGAGPVDRGAVELGAGGVDLGGGSGGVCEGEVDPHRAVRGDDGRRDAGPGAHRHERVVRRGREHRLRPDPSAGEDAGDVDALPARGVVDGRDAVDPAHGERRGQLRGPVHRRVHGERDDHGSTTSIPWVSSAEASGPGGGASVTRTSTPSSGANETRNS